MTPSKYLIGNKDALEQRYTSAEVEKIPMLFLGTTDQYEDFPNLKRFKLMFLVRNSVWTIAEDGWVNKPLFEELNDESRI